MIDIVVPTLNAASTLAPALTALSAARASWPCRLVVCDGGSSDNTAAIARRLGAQVVVAPRGRGSQLARGAVGSGEWLLFVHADTVLDPGWVEAASRFMAIPANADRAGYFRLRFDSAAPQARRIERWADWRCRVLGLPYGDQGLLLTRRLYEKIGGFHPLPLMEDVDIARRIGARRLAMLPADATTSARRYERDGWWRRPLRNLLCLSLYLCGLPPHLVAKLYA